MAELKVLLFSKILSASAGGPSYPLGPKAILLASVVIVIKTKSKKVFFVITKPK